MKIFGFFVGKSKRLMALVIVLVLLASAVGVAASEATAPEDVPDLSDEKEDDIVSEDKGPTLEECIEKCRKKDPNAMGEITKYGRCFCGCKSGWGYALDNPEKCVDCNEYCSKRSKDDSNITGVKETKDLCLCRCKNKNQQFDPFIGRCEKVCPDHSTLVGTECVCDEGYTKVSEKACCPESVFCYLGQSCKDCVDNCICPTGSVCRPGSELADSRGCVVEQCNKNGKCEKGEDCLTCENDCKCTGELKCHPDDPLADKRGCIKVVCNYDGTCDAGENCRYCPDCGCRSHETCEICDGLSAFEPRWMCIGNLGKYDAATIKSLSYGYVWIRRSMTSGPVWIKAQPGMTLRADDEVRLRRMDNEHTHVDIEWSNGARSIAFFRRDSGDKEGRFYMGKIRSETRDPSTGEPAFPPDNPTVIEKYGEDAYDVAVFIYTSCLKIPNPITLPAGVLLSNEKLGQEPMTFINVKSEVYLEPRGNGEHTLYVFEGSAEVTSYDEDAHVVAQEIITAGESSVIDARGNPAPTEPFDPDSIDRFWDVNPLSLRKQEMMTSGLTFESRSKPSGSSVQIPLTLKGIEEKIGNMDLTLGYDSSVLEATEVIKGGLTAESLFEHNIIDGTIKISLADSQGFSGDGSIAYVKFNVIGAEGSSSPLQIAAIAANRAEDYETLEIPTNDGVFRVIFISTEESGGLTVSVSDTTGVNGSTVEVPINLEGASEVGSMDIVLNYDANVLSAVDVEAGALGKNALIESNTARDGEVIIALADSSGINGDGTVASVAFEVIGDAGTTSYLTLEEVSVHNLDLGEMIPNTECGTFLVI